MNIRQYSGSDRHRRNPFFFVEIKKKNVKELFTITIHPPKTSESASLSLQSFLYGKALLLEELKDDYDLKKQEEAGEIAYHPAITVNEKNYRCNRCGTTDRAYFYAHTCSNCQALCVYCRRCIMMGKVKNCAKLVSWTGKLIEFPTIQNELNWQGQLSESQLIASNAVTLAIQQKTKLLIWAVCGSGKTELLFYGLHEALIQGERVCLATPRTDVVLELYPRLQKVFPQTSIAALYGGSEQKHDCAQLVISTTHQLLRYEQAFDVMIVDEVDAFPYSVDESLQFAVEKARKPKSSLIYLTATPSKIMKKAMHSHKLPFVTIPARFHRHALPVPKFIWCGNWRKSFSRNRLPRSLHLWLQQKRQQQTPFLVFFPSIDVMKQNAPLFQQLVTAIEVVYAEDSERKEKVQSLREGKIQGLLTTTILERGITIPRLEVAVIGAEEEIFTESALVQIAGRVGRSSTYPNGDVLFFHYGKTREMLKAVKQIQEMNIQARKRGLIDDLC